MNDKLEKIKKMSENVERIFYMVGSENFSLKEKAENRVAELFASHLGFTKYGIRSGPSVQNHLELAEELSTLSFDKFEVIYLEKETGRSTILSGINKKEFLDELEKFKNLHSGSIISGLSSLKNDDVIMIDW